MVEAEQEDRQSATDQAARFAAGYPCSTSCGPIPPKRRETRPRNHISA